MKLVKKLLAAAVCTTAGVTCLASCGGSDSAGLSKEGVMVVGMECAYNPFNWTETVANSHTVAIANQPNAFADGYDVTMARKIADELNLELQIQAISWDGLIPALNAGTIDMIIAGMSRTEDRLQTIDFTDGYYTSEEVLLVNADSAYAAYTKLSQFEGARINGQLGTLYASFAEQAKTKVNSVYDASKDLGTVSEMLNEIKANIIDATVVELPVAEGIVANDPSLAIVRLDATDTFEASDEDVMVCIGVRKEFTYTSQINDILASISADTRNTWMSEAVSRSHE